jgi:ubiquinone/menaquinone biosynthesis C-methylase UbiE
VVGGQGDRGAAIAGLAEPMRAAYGAAAGAWQAGPGQLYAELSRALVAQAGRSVRGCRVLDLGAGTGAAGSAALAAGAGRVAAVDVAEGMLARCPAALAPVVGDGCRLPFRDGCFDLVLAAFALSHMPSVPGFLAEARRVGGAIAACSFAPGWGHPAKQAIDSVLPAFGYLPPDWYRVFKDQAEPPAEDPGLLETRARAAGFTGVRIRHVPVLTSLSTPAQLAAWRLGMAHIAPFAATLPPGQRAELQRAAEDAVAGLSGAPVRVEIIVLTGR